MAEQTKSTMEQMGESLKKPWEEAKEFMNNMFSSFRVGDSPRKPTEAPKAAQKPWEEAREYADSIANRKPATEPSKPSTIDHKFERVFKNMVQAESLWRHRDKNGNLTKSEAGALGITQVMPTSGAKPGYGVKPIKDDSEEEYLRFGREYLRAMLNKYDGDYEYALAAYNAGPGNVDKAIRKGGKNWKKYLPRQSETLPYIDKILGINNGTKR